MKCEKCGAEMIDHGFDRRLIRRGKDKGKSIVTTYFSCPVCNPRKEGAENEPII
jgi:hypothetical protein